MNLWRLFPESLVRIDYILYLPYAAVVAYLILIWVVLTYKNERPGLLVFILLSLLGSAVMLFTLGPGIGLVFPPLLLIIVMVYPLVFLGIRIARKEKNGVIVWSYTSVAGWLHSLSWIVWLIALAGS